MTADPPCAPIPHVFTDDWRGQQRRLRGMCMACPMLAACRDHALTHDVSGYAAGMTPRQRVNIRRAGTAAA